MDDLDAAILTSYAVNAPKELDARRKALVARLRRDPSLPIAPQFTREEMREAATRLMASVLSTGKLPKAPPS